MEWMETNGVVYTNWPMRSKDYMLPPVSLLSSSNWLHS